MKRSALASGPVIYRGLAVRVGSRLSSHVSVSNLTPFAQRHFFILATRQTGRPQFASFFPLTAPARSAFPLHLRSQRHVQTETTATVSKNDEAPTLEQELVGVNRSDPEDVACAILASLKGAQGEAARQMGARLKALLRDLSPSEGVGRALVTVSRELGLRKTGRLIPLLFSRQEKGSINRLASLLLTIAHSHAQGNVKAKNKAVVLGELTNGVIENWELEDIAKLLRVIPRSPYFSLAEGKEVSPQGAEEWTPRELGTLVGQLKHDRAERRDLEFFMDLLVKLLTTSEKDGGWGREKLVEPPAAKTTSAAPTTLPTTAKPGLAYDLDFVPRVVGPALAPFFSYWGNQDYATMIQCLITAFSQHAVTTYGRHTLNKEQFQDFCLEMMARTTIEAKPTVGMLHYMINDVTSGWEEDDVDQLSARLEERMRPYSFFRRWFRKTFGLAEPSTD